MVITGFFHKIKILFSGMKIIVKEDTLLDMVIHMVDNVGLVHQMPYVCDRSGFASILEKVSHICSFLLIFPRTHE